MATIDNTNDNDFMFKRFKDLADIKSNANFEDFAYGFKACYFSMNSGYNELELREKVKSIGVEDYFNDSCEEVAKKIEETYPEVANEISNKRIANVIDGQNFTENQMDKIMVGATTENIKHWMVEATDEDIEILVNWMFTSCRDAILNELANRVH